MREVHNHERRRGVNNEDVDHKETKVFDTGLAACKAVIISYFRGSKVTVQESMLGCTMCV